MPFIVPQFIEREAKIFGPFAWKQFVYVGIGIAVSIFLYFFIPSFFLFLIAALVILAICFGLAFLKIGGAPLPAVMKNFFLFLTRQKIYLWRKKAVYPKILKETEKPKEEFEETGEEIKEESQLKIPGRINRLKKLSTFLETKTR